MKILSCYIFLAICGSAAAFTNPGPGVHRSGGSADDTQAGVRGAPSGAAIEIPSGQFELTKGGQFYSGGVGFELSEGGCE